MTKIILASASPRRRELLASLGVDFRVASGREVNEVYPEDMSAEEVAPYLSRLKAEAYRTDLAADELLITADTVVILDGIVLGKPADLDDARRMLRSLSGRTHKVITGVTVADSERMETIAAVTSVTFADLSDDEINYYVERYRPLDKAGAYGIQEWIGCIGVREIDGSYYNVMGLPLHRLYTLLRDFGVSF